MQLTVGQFFWGQLTARVPPLVEKDLEGKTIIVTGANIGIGYETAKHFAKMNAGKIILACRDQKRGEAAVQSAFTLSAWFSAVSLMTPDLNIVEIKEETGHKNVELWLLDLANFASVRSFADRYEKDGGRLDILVENAAVIPTFDGVIHPTVDGWEST